MNRRIGQALRVVAGLTLVALSLRELTGPGFVAWIAGAEVVAGVAFCLPGVWRGGAVGLLVVFGAALIHHAMGGQFVASLLFAALVVCMALTYERP